jgi:two-component system chemotaxis response regulator CheY
MTRRLFVAWWKCCCVNVGLKIEVVHDGNTALDRLTSSRFDIIVCDWEMEPMTGLEVLHQVRYQKRTQHIPIILMSAKKEPHWIFEATQAGADCLIAKPFNAAMLRAKIAQIGGKLERQIIDRGPLVV